MVCVNGMQEKRTVLLIGTLDTKGLEMAFVRDVIQALGHLTLTMDVGILAEPPYRPDISQHDVAEAAGTTIESLVDKQDTGAAIAAMARGAEKITLMLHERRQIHGVLGIGGSKGAAIATTAMGGLPFGFPKVMVSPVACGDTRRFLDGRNITMVHSVADLNGLNRITSTVLSGAAAAIVGMLGVKDLPVDTHTRQVVAITAFGTTTPAATVAREVLEGSGYEVVVFAASGGGKAMEGLISEGMIAGVLDLTTTELADELVGGALSAGPNRLEAAGTSGIPQVVVPGAIDMVNFIPGSVPEKFQGRHFYQHSPVTLLMRTTVDENRRLGEIFANKLNKTHGNTAVVIPTRGFSAYDKAGCVFHDPEADRAFVESLKANIDPKISLVARDNHINDLAFARYLSELLISLFGE